MVTSLIKPSEQKRILQWVEEAVNEGAELLTGGEPEKNGIQPTVLYNVSAKVKVSYREIFGPVVLINVVESSEEALEKINDSNYGLNAGIFTNDLQQALHMAHHVEVGQVMINDIPLRFDHMPYGGVKDSGYGREGFENAVKEMTEMKMISINYGYKGDGMEIPVFHYEGGVEPDSRAVYYPYLLTAWEVAYRTIFRKRVERIHVMTNRIKGGSSLAEYLPHSSNISASVNEVMQANISTEEAVLDAREMVRRYYVHIVRSWSVPIIRQMNEQPVYVPYHIVTKPGRFQQTEHVYLYEPLSNAYERLKKIPEIHEFYKEKVI